MINKVIPKGQVYKVAKAWKAKKGLTKFHVFFSWKYLMKNK